MKLRFAEVTAFLLIIVVFLVSWHYYPEMPYRVASHWNSRGQVDGYMSRLWGTFLLPVILVPMWLLFVFIPRVDPKKENIKTFRKYYDGAILLIMLFLIYLDTIVLVWNLGHPIGVLRWISPGFGVLIIGMGVLIQHTTMNWTIGIRTPWTLSSATVWKKTHTLGAKMFYLSGVLSFLGLIFPKFAFLFVLVPIVASILSVFVFSYWCYRQEQQQHAIQ